jgi:uncharacterized glyoxalase superfamily protein PhnB
MTPRELPVVIERVIPTLVYDNLEAAHKFLVAAFGFEAGLAHYDDNARVVHAEVRAGPVTIWLHRALREHALESPRGRETSAGGLVVLVDNVDAHYERAVRHGASVEMPPTNQPYNQREYAARDPEGHRWWFATAKQSKD